MSKFSGLLTAFLLVVAAGCKPSVTCDPPSATTLTTVPATTPATLRAALPATKPAAVFSEEQKKEFLDNLRPGDLLPRTGSQLIYATFDPADKINPPAYNSYLVSRVVTLAQGKAVELKSDTVDGLTVVTAEAAFLCLTRKNTDDQTQVAFHTIPLVPGRPESTWGRTHARVMTNDAQIKLKGRTDYDVVWLNGKPYQTIRVTKNIPVEDLKFESREWYAPGLGLVRAENFASNSDTKFVVLDMERSIIAK